MEPVEQLIEHIASPQSSLRESGFLNESLITARTFSILIPREPFINMTSPSFMTLLRCRPAPSEVASWIPLPLNSETACVINVPTPIKRSIGCSDIDCPNFSWEGTPDSPSSSISPNTTIALLYVEHADILISSLMDSSVDEGFALYTSFRKVAPSY